MFMAWRIEFRSHYWTMQHALWGFDILQCLTNPFLSNAPFDLHYSIWEQFALNIAILQILPNISSSIDLAVALAS